MTDKERAEEIYQDEKVIVEALIKLVPNFKGLAAKKKIAVIKRLFDVNVCNADIDDRPMEAIIELITIRMLKLNPCPKCDGLGKIEGNICSTCKGDKHYNVNAY